MLRVLENSNSHHNSALYAIGLSFMFNMISMIVNMVDLSLTRHTSYSEYTFSFWHGLASALIGEGVLGGSFNKMFYATLFCELLIAIAIFYCICPKSFFSSNNKFKFFGSFLVMFILSYAIIYKGVVIVLFVVSTLKFGL